MGLFGRPSRDLQEQVTALHRRLEDLGEAYASIARDVDRMTGQVQNVTAEVQLQWEKVQKAIGRLSKRDAIEEKANGQDEADLNERIRRGEPIG